MGTQGEDGAIMEKLPVNFKLTIFSVDHDGMVA